MYISKLHHSSDRKLEHKRYNVCNLSLEIYSYPCNFTANGHTLIERILVKFTAVIISLNLFSIFYENNGVISPLNKQSIAVKFQFINLSEPLSGTLSIPIKKHFYFNAIYSKKEKEKYRLILTEDKLTVRCIKRIGWRSV